MLTYRLPSWPAPARPLCGVAVCRSVMRDIADGLAAWRADGVAFAVATVVRTWHSAPRQPGAAMAVSATGEALGSVSGGCVEGAVYEAAREVIETGKAQTQTYGVSDDDAFEVGLTCGGTIEVLIQPDTAMIGLEQILDAIRSGRPIATASLPGAQLVVWPQNYATTDTWSPERDSAATEAWPSERRSATTEAWPSERRSATTEAWSSGRPGAATEAWPSGRSGEPGHFWGVAGTLGDPGLDYAAVQQATGMLAAGRTGTVHLGEHGEQRPDDVSVFVQSYVSPPRMIVFGAIDFAGAVARIGRFLGYHVTVCDARPVFATRKRFPEADELVVQWPHKYLESTDVDERTVLCVPTHDPKFDVPLLEIALRTPARYIGAMGSRRTHDDRLKRLRAAGVDEESLARLCSPIGLDLGARTPEETAVAIAAEIIAQAWGGSGRRLAELETPIHP